MQIVQIKISGNADYHYHHQVQYTGTQSTTIAHHVTANDVNVDAQNFSLWLLQAVKLISYRPLGLRLRWVIIAYHENCGTQMQNHSAFSSLPKHTVKLHKKTVSR